MKACNLLKQRKCKICNKTYSTYTDNEFCDNPKCYLENKYKDSKPLKKKKNELDF